MLDVVIIGAGAGRRWWYAFTPVGGLAAPRVFTSPVADTLFFAGEHTHDGGQAACVHGAIETGERTLRRQRR